MLRFKPLIIVFISLFVLNEAKADDMRKELQKYINEIITEVKEADDPEEKREILNDIFDDLQKAFAAAKNSPYVPAEDHKGINELEEMITERYDELNGLNGFTKVPDNKLNEFATFTLQSIEQADTVLTISLTTLLLLIILAILIF